MHNAEIGQSVGDLGLYTQVGEGRAGRLGTSGVQVVVIADVGGGAGVVGEALGVVHLEGEGRVIEGQWRVVVRGHLMDPQGSAGAGQREARPHTVQTLLPAWRLRVGASIGSRPWRRPGNR
jgi:hypothetical protein